MSFRIKKSPLKSFQIVNNRSSVVFDSCCLCFQGFFHRNSSRRAWAICPDPKHCSAIKIFRSMCVTCRFLKCLNVGMSKKGKLLNTKN